MSIVDTILGAAGVNTDVTIGVDYERASLVGSFVRTQYTAIANGQSHAQALYNILDFAENVNGGDHFAAIQQVALVVVGEDIRSNGTGTHWVDFTGQPHLKGATGFNPGVGYGQEDSIQMVHAVAGLFMASHGGDLGTLAAITDEIYDAYDRNLPIDGADTQLYHSTEWAVDLLSNPEGIEALLSDQTIVDDTIAETLRIFAFDGAPGGTVLTHLENQEQMDAFISAAVENGINSGDLTPEAVVTLFQIARDLNDNDLMRAYINGLQASDSSCFGGEVPIDMWPLDPSLKLGPNGIYDQEAVRAKIWKKPIELIRVGDIVVSFDDNDNLVPGPVTQTFENNVKILLDFHGTRVTPGHVYYRADSKKSYKFETLIDILHDDGVIQHQDGTMIRAATNVPVESPRDGFIKAVTRTRKADGTFEQNDEGRIRLGTRFLVGTGKERKSWAVADLIERGGGIVGDDELIRVGDSDPMPFLWEFGDTLPKPEDFVLTCSGTTLEDIYKAAEWESQGPRLSAPMVLDRGPVQPLKGAALSAMPRNEPLDVVHSPMASVKPRRTLNRKQRKAMEAKQRRATKAHKRVAG